MRQQHGFTLLELMVAMAIFAMLAVAGWQVFDGVNRARERAQFHADQLAVLQYAYLQLQQDMGQIIAYQAPSTQNSSANGSNLNTNTNSEQDSVAAEPFMSLNGEQLSFVRFADPDPSYQTSPSLQRVEYVFTDQRLIRRQYNSIESGADSVSLDTILLSGVTAARWQAYLPEVSNDFPSAGKQQINNNNSNNLNIDEAETVLLPKGIGMSFTYQDMPITWQWALAPQPLPVNSSGLDTNIGGNSDNENDPDNMTNGQ
ncbi:type II secretion system minor pseudopilin GspJ [Psychrobacter sp. Cmf 22.2]|uniref:type II secretion system minor pseudopilin GspJ n=1 Tax=Psychrobacter sp. Cmf 22.2 TaxID=1926478 RepID=UPI0009468EF0|nr:type II secretion system minor pseudopilin GspJ [Psychrobacter sp. Cmf 22.2]OLF36155.1 type II secretion system protein GspJ [Psychrobacter sp. Cmf 22.2]